MNRREFLNHSALAVAGAAAVRDAHAQGDARSRCAELTALPPDSMAMPATSRIMITRPSPKIVVPW